jgi:DNA-directed RNA polymerase specialized sigma24 family protein
MRVCLRDLREWLEAIGDLILAAALRKHKPDGTLYTRLPATETQLHILGQLPRDEILSRCEVRQRADPRYVPSECLLHLVRACRADNSTAWFERLYKILYDRVLRALPRPDTADGETSSLTKEQVREKASERFVEMLAADRQVYEERLDFFEIRFDMALKRMRQDAQKQAWRDENRSRPIEYDEASGELSPEIEKAAGSINPFEGIEFRDEAFRLRLDAAIEDLPPEQSRTIQMLMLDFQIHSEDPDVNTICKVLGKTPKTIWNYRERAIKALKKALGEGEDQ